MNYKVCIPAAGLGTRLESLTHYLNKSLVTVANKPVISHIIEKFQPEVEIVVALGYKGQDVRDFLEMAYPERRFQFAKVDPFEGEGSGLGLSLLCCRQYLQSPFIFCSCDTIVREAIPEPSENWMGYAEIADTSPYRGIRKQGDMVAEICEKGSCADVLPYIGLAGIHNFEAFWTSMTEQGKTAVEMGESAGLRDLIGQGIRPRQFTWYDTGNMDALAAARKALRKPNAPNILDKADEAIWFVDNAVIKFSADERFIANRVERSTQLEGWCPKITGHSRNMYRYDKVEGQVLSEIVTVPLFRKLLGQSGSFWKTITLSPEQKKTFLDDCRDFYEVKTRKRIEQFYRTFEVEDQAETINDAAVPTMAELLDKIDWQWLSEGVPVRFHGDFHFENILYNKDTDRFWFLDWRQDFAGKLHYGDIYYDLAKLGHGIIVSHEMISNEMFDVSWEGTQVRFDFHRKHTLVECERYFEEYVINAGYDWRKVKIMTYLIYLNIAALHHFPYSHMLYYLGKHGINELL